MKILCLLVAGLVCSAQAKEKKADFHALAKVEIPLKGEWQFTIDPNRVGEEQRFHLPKAAAWEWKKVKVPGRWEQQGWTQSFPGYSSNLPYNGVAWYRRALVIPKDWAGYELQLSLGCVDDAVVAYFNGERVGKTRAMHEDPIFAVPSSSVTAGKRNLIALKVTDYGGEGGLVGDQVYLRVKTPWDEVAFNLLTPESAYLFESGKPVTFTVKLARIPEVLHELKLRVALRDFYGKQVKQKTVPVTEIEQGSWQGEFTWGKLPPGHYDVMLRLLANKTVVREKLSAIAVVPMQVTFKNPEASPFALGGGALFHMPLEEHSTRGELRLYQHHRVGALWGRNDLWWGIIEPRKGTFDWAKADSTVGLFEKYGINLLGILCYFSAWSGDKAPRNFKEVNQFVKYVEQMLTRYAGRVNYWEVWNEPNLAQFWAPQPNPSLYTLLLKKSYQAAKRSHPGVKIVGMVTSGVDLDFIERCLEQGAGKYMDIISVHPYHGTTPEDWSANTELGKLPQLQHLLKRYGVDVPIWITEAGWETRGQFGPCRQAEYLVKFFVKTVASGLVERVYWFNLTDWGERGHASGGHFGLLYSDQSPKPSYVAYCTMVGLLRDFKTVRELGNLPPLVVGYRFDRESRATVMVYWSRQGRRSIHLPVGIRKAVDLMGRSKNVDKRTYELDTTPVFFF